METRDLATRFVEVEFPNWLAHAVANVEVFEGERSAAKRAYLNMREAMRQAVARGDLKYIDAICGLRRQWLASRRPRALVEENIHAEV